MGEPQGPDLLLLRCGLPEGLLEVLCARWRPERGELAGVLARALSDCGGSRSHPRNPAHLSAALSVSARRQERAPDSGAEATGPGPVDR